MNIKQKNRLLINKRRNSKQITGKISTKYNLKKEEEIYSISNSCEIIENDIYINYNMKINLNSKEGQTLIKNIITKNPQIFIKKFKDITFTTNELKEIENKIKENIENEQKI